jgi:hypothetical protein
MTLFIHYVVVCQHVGFRKQAFSSINITTLIEN